MLIPQGARIRPGAAGRRNHPHTALDSTADRAVEPDDHIGAVVAVDVSDDGILHRRTRDVGEGIAQGASAAIPEKDIFLVAVNDFRCTVALEVEKGRAGLVGGNVLRGPSPADRTIVVEQDVARLARHANFRIGIVVHVRQGRRAAGAALRDGDRAGEPGAIGLVDIEASVATQATVAYDDDLRIGIGIEIPDSIVAVVCRTQLADQPALAVVDRAARDKLLPTVQVDVRHDRDVGIVDRAPLVIGTGATHGAVAVDDGRTAYDLRCSIALEVRDEGRVAREVVGGAVRRDGDAPLERTIVFQEVELGAIARADHGDLHLAIAVDVANRGRRVDRKKWKTGLPDRLARVATQCDHRTAAAGNA